MEKSKKPKKKEHDPLKNLKYKAYCRSQTPPGDDTGLDDLVNFAKFFLCKMASKLWNDPIWDKYTDEEILIEYFAHLFAKDEVAKREFEVEMNAGEALYGEDIFDWLDRKVKENQKEMSKKLDEMPDKISFKPGVRDKEE